jgi:hypothetical protein
MTPITNASHFSEISGLFKKKSCLWLNEISGLNGLGFTTEQVNAEIQFIEFLSDTRALPI